MARWAYVTVPVSVALLIGTWWAAGTALAAPTPDLGNVIVVTPPAVDTDATPPAPTESIPPDPGPVATVAPAPPPDAGDDDPDDAGDDAEDDADDSEE